MFAQFTRAIVRPPAETFADGLTSVTLGMPDVALATAQHAAYCAALERHGVRVTSLAADAAYPDSTFVEDTALIVPGAGAILARPGAASRAGEVTAIGDALASEFSTLAHIEPPGTLDAGDICEAGDAVFIGLSHRTNDAGAAQLSAWLAAHGWRSHLVDIRGIDSILHLKSGMSAIAPTTLVCIEALAAHPAFAGYDLIRVPAGEEYGANCVRVNDVVFVSEGQPQLDARLRARGFTLEVLAMSEFRKMDGGLSCLSLRF
jgi:dimethylargininase